MSGTAGAGVVSGAADGWLLAGLSTGVPASVTVRAPALGVPLPSPVPGSGLTLDDWASCALGVAAAAAPLSVLPLSMLLVPCGRNRLLNSFAQSGVWPGSAGFPDENGFWRSCIGAAGVYVRELPCGLAKIPSMTCRLLDT